MTFTSETLPADHKAAIRQLKRELRAQIGDVQAVFDKLSDKIATRVAEINALKNKGESVWPVIPFADVKNGTITDAQREAVKRRGCAVIKGHFPREQALAWDRSMLDYLDLNKFDEVYKGPGDNFFGTLTASRPEIYPIYWSQAQMQARQSEAMAQVQSFLNRLWTFESNGKQWFNPDVSVIYPDRIRRRPPGTTSKGLGAHTDSGALERWLLPAYQQVFARVFDGNVEKYDPWNAAHRTEVEEYTVDNTTKCSVFRTFQGWTALSDMIPGLGLLHVVPIPEAMAYILLRPLLDDVPEDELCGVAPGRVLPISEKWHPLLVEALTSIPALEAGDSVWWHCDVIHSVAPVENQQGWGNVMYIPAAPMCEKNLAYAKKVKEALETGASPGDFPREDYEKSWQDRFTVNDLNIHGKRALGMA
ncbi:TPA: DUF1479 domain-containing protein [Enterobacter bugandensis]|uniref:DUF1479 domain-containing protein n=1 Tax=Enterobacter TaxID=547 RepID=UPI001872D8B5|nr:MULTISPECIES: DUF1479 domain-containing protein [Enterobacter]EHN8826992.1 DUF1479 domain-containing protein [Enterobacter bugandensis]EHN8847245.1 DUF1479 domain-containing protein [Enterobacter bugandensis]MBE4807227.1 DUF1479 domain-containing protein [Enterobacter cloacae complex sp. P43RS]MCK6703953.1 DUF1479 domain-containing protein [Enterobacter bugandensis]MCK6780091.1 DUF1479 domain-containing protein [Enterobacter bugandensis]